MYCVADPCKGNMEQTKMKRTTSREQFICLVSKMKEHPDIARNFSKSAPNVVEKFWESVREELNSIGPPFKSIAEWKKVWSDFKSSIKKKLVHNKRELQATGGGENREMPLTCLEEDVAALVCLNDCIGGIYNAKQFGVPQKRSYDDTPSTSRNVPQKGRYDDTPSTSRNVPQRRIHPTANDDEAIEDHDSDIENNPNICNQPPKRRKRPEQFDLLDKQIEVQERLYAKLSDGVQNQEEHFNHMKEHFERLNRSLEGLLEETNRHNIAMEKAAFEKLKVKKELLDIELRNVARQLTPEK